MTIGFALMLNIECHNFIRQVQLELHQEVGIRLARQIPHITIKSPFDINDISDYAVYLEKLCEDTKPMDLEFDGFGNFGNKVIFLNVKANLELLNLHRKIVKDLGNEFDLVPHEFEGENIRFHASIAGFNDEDSFTQASVYLSKYQPKFRFRAEELGIFHYLGEADGWIVNKKFRLTNG